MDTVGFSGSQDGCTTSQLTVLTQLLVIMREKGFVYFRYGMCVGADDEAAMIAGNLGYYLDGYPGDNLDKRGKVVPNNEHPPESNLDRNWKIAAGDVLIACPKQPQEIRRSGTWSTVRRAKKLGTSYIIIQPDGFTKGTLRFSSGELFVTTQVEDL